MISLLISSAVDLGLESRLGQTRLQCIKLVFVASQLSMQHRGERAKDWLARNQDNKFEWGVMSNRGLLFQ
jgi:hypothetical protein